MANPQPSTASRSEDQKTFPRTNNEKDEGVLPGKVVRLRDSAATRPRPQNRSLPPRRLPNSAVRSREYLTADEVERVIAAAKSIGRHGQRDATIILLGYRHGLRVGELVSMRWDQLDLKQGLLHVTRSKNGSPSNHPIRGPEIRALRSLRRAYPETPYVFVTERKGPMTESNVRKMVARAGCKAGLPFPVHPHMLRHACGYKLANDGHDPRAIQHYLGEERISL